MSGRQNVATLLVYHAHRTYTTCRVSENRSARRLARPRATHGHDTIDAERCFKIKILDTKLSRWFQSASNAGFDSLTTIECMCILATAELALR